jgi:serine protease Do
MNPEFPSGAPAPRRRRFGLTAGLSASALLLTGSLIGYTASVGARADNPVAVEAAPVAVAADAATRTVGDGVDSYAPLVNTVAPAVVTIRSERRVHMTSSQLPDDPLFRQFFGDRFQMPQPRDRREGGLGSGVIVRPDGYILTNNHVVDHADTVKVEFTDGRTFDAKVVGTDAPSDLAVLKIDATNLHTLPLGDSDQVRVGDVALAVGNPLGVGQTVTMGIISAKGRATGAGNGSYEDFLQTDAPINQGNSGGALVNTRGELIGINSQILSPSGGNIGIGFAIPANMARNVMNQLIDNGSVRRGMLGVTVQPVTADIARSLGIEAHGALVNAVTPGSAADKAGLRRGDVITAIDGQTVKDSNGLRNNVSERMPGTTTRVTVLRDGHSSDFNVTLGELEATAGDQPESGTAESGGGYGLSVEPLTPALARELGVAASSGVVIRGVRDGSPAAEAGLRNGDVIEQVDGQKVASGEALKSALDRRSDAPALLLVHRGDTTVFVPLDRP